MLELVRARRFADAARAVARFEFTQVFSRGLGIAWDQGDDPAGVIPVLATMFDGAPKILAKVAPEEFEALSDRCRYFTPVGDGSEARWLREGSVSRSGFENDVAVRMFISSSGSRP
jgi:hypothetical protein